MITRSPALFLCVTHILLPYMEIYSIRWNQGFITSHILIKVNQNLVSLTLDLLATALSNTHSLSHYLFSFPPWRYAKSCTSSDDTISFSKLCGELSSSSILKSFHKKATCQPTFIWFRILRLHAVTELSDDTPEDRMQLPSEFFVREMLHRPGRLLRTVRLTRDTQEARCSADLSTSVGLRLPDFRRPFPRRENKTVSVNPHGMAVFSYS